MFIVVIESRVRICGISTYLPTLCPRWLVTPPSLTSTRLHYRAGQS